MIWYPTDLPFLDFPTVFNSKEWETNYPDLRGLGEIRRDTAARKNWHPGIPGLTGDHVCGTPEQFLYGDPDYTGPPIEYDADRIPLCCGRRPVAFVTGGARPAAHVSVNRVKHTYATGSARPTARVRMRYRLLGRVTTSARPSVILEPLPPPTARVTGGARPAATVTHFSAHARVVGAARPAVAISHHNHAVGRVTGGARPSSWASLSVSCPGPVSTCGAAAPGSLGHNCDFEYVPLDTDSWRSWNTVPGHDYQLHIESALGTYDYEIYEGDDCGSLTLLGTGSMSDVESFANWTATKPRAWVHWSYPFASELHVIIGVYDVT